MDLVIDQVVQFEHVDIAHCHLAMEFLTGTTVIEVNLARTIKAGFFKHTNNIRLTGAVEDRGGHRNAATQVVAKLDDFTIGQLFDAGDVFFAFIDIIKLVTQVFHLATTVGNSIDKFADLFTKTTRSPTKVGFKDLANVHTRRNAQRVQNDIDRRTVFEVRHVFNRHNARYDTLVPVTAGHLVTRLHFTFNRDKDFDHLHHARRQFVTSLQLVDLVVETSLKNSNRFLELLFQSFDVRHDIVISNGDLTPQTTCNTRKAVFGDLARQALRTINELLTQQKVFQTTIEVALKNGAFVVTVLCETLDLGALDCQGTFVLVNATTREHADFNNGTELSRRDTQRRITDVGCFFTEDGAQKFFFRRHRAFALRRYLTDKDIARLDFRTDVDNARLVEVFERFFTDVRNITGDFFLTQLGIAGHDFEFLDMDRGINVITGDTLGQKDGILEVVTVPRHERDKHVTAKGKFTHIGTRTIRDDVAFFDNIANFHQRTLVDAAALVGTLIFQQGVNIDTRFRCGNVTGCANNHTGRVNGFNNTVTACDQGCTRITCHRNFHTGTDIRRFGADQRNRLTLHVRAHQCAVRVIVLKERNERGCDRYQLLRRDVHKVDLFGAGHIVVTGFTGVDQFVGKAEITVKRFVRLCDDITAFFDRRQIDHLGGHLAVDNLAVRAFDEAVLVDTCKGRQRVDQTNVRTFRRFNRADTTIVGRMNVTNFKAGTLTGQTTRAKRRKTTFVGNFRKRVGLVHELRQLRRAEEFTHSSRNRLGIDQVMRHHVVDLDRAHTLADRTFHTQQTNTELVFHQLADRTQTTVAKMVNIVNLATTVFQVDQNTDDFQNVFTAQDTNSIRAFQIQTRIHLHTANSRKIITLCIEEQAFEHGFRTLEGRRFARAHHAIDVHKGFFAVAVLVQCHGVAQIRTNLVVVDHQQTDGINAPFLKLLEHFLGQFVTGFCQDLTGFAVNQVIGHEPAIKLIFRNQDFLDALFGDFGSRTLGDFRTGCCNNFTAVGINKIVNQLLADITVCTEIGNPTICGTAVFSRLIVIVEDLFRGQAFDFRRIDRAPFFGTLGTQLFGLFVFKSHKQRGRRQFAATVDTDIKNVFRVEFEIEPRTTIRNHTRGKQIFARAVALTFVMVKEDARRTVHLRNDHTLGAVHDKGTVFGHERHVAHIHVLFLDIADRTGTRVLVDIPNNQAECYAQRCGKSHATLATLFGIVFRLLKLIRNEFKSCAFRKIFNRKDALEHFLETCIVPLLLRGSGLQKLVVGILLNLNEIRERSDFADPSKAFADALSTSKGLIHHRSFNRASPHRPNSFVPALIRFRLAQNAYSTTTPEPRTGRAFT